MTDASRIAASLKRRSRAERRFRLYGRAALIVSLAMLAVLLSSLMLPGWRGLTRPVATIAWQAEKTEDVRSAGLAARTAWLADLPPGDITARRARLLLLAPGYEAEAARQAASSRIDLPLSDAAARYLRGEGSSLTAGQRTRLDTLRDAGSIRTEFHWRFLSGGDSRAPEKAGMGGSIAGSLLTLLITMGIAFPVGIGAAVYLEEFSRKGRVRDLVEVNINNLAAVPSIVYGLLGLAVYLNLFGLPRSSALVGGLTLALLILPVIIITTRAALGAVPPSIKAGALALGASPLQVVRHHTLPLALPGILTGTILGVARALGETAPLLMIGMVAFVADVPKTPLDAATAMPVQVYLWASSPEAGFAEKTASGILVLLVILLTLNLGAIILRRKTERRW